MILVSGASGSIGSRLVDRLVDVTTSVPMVTGQQLIEGATVPQW